MEETTFDFAGSKEKLDRLSSVLAAMPADQVRQFNLSVPTAVAYGMRVFRSFTEDRDRFAATFTREAFNPDDYSDFPDRVGALWHANGMLLQATDPERAISDVLTVAKPLHQKFAKAALYLFGDDEKLGNVVKQIREGQGHMDLADDLTRYAILFTQNWDKADGQSAINQGDIDAAQRIGAQLLDSLTATQASSTDDLRDQRDRAGEYFIRAINDIRDAAAYVFRNDEDALNRYPSIYSKKHTRKAKSNPAETDTTAPAEAGNSADPE